MRFKWIVKNEIALSGLPDEALIDEAHNNGIRCVISLTEETLPETLLKADMEYRHFPVKSLETLDLFEAKEFLLYTDFLRSVHFPFLIYCKEGTLRSPFFAALYLIYQGKTAKDAAKIVESNANVKFKENILKMLEEWEKYRMFLYLNEEMHAFYQFNELVKVLRKQCPWDREQTHKSLIPELIEESLELAEAIKKNDFHGIKEELGDVLLQVVLHSVISEEEGEFSIADVINGIFEKMYRRHPHVFGKSAASSSGEVLKQWEEIKKEEKKDRPVDIAKVLASLITAFDIQEEARSNGFDFEETSQIFFKIDEEVKEVKEALDKGENVSEELGDLLFSVINLARFLKVDPAHALFLSMDKFGRRFEYVKSKAGNNLREMPADEKDKLWEEAKKNV